MASAKVYTNLLLETNSAIKALHLVLDYVDLVNNHKDDLDPKALEAGTKIRALAEDAGKEVEETRRYVDEALNKLEVDPEDCSTAANNLLLYYNTFDDCMTQTSQKIQSYKENSYWWRYWTGVLECLLKIRAEEKTEEKTED
ncbi:MAG: hypothetical protein V3U74_07930 [Thermodesulfobacteriota bacterium]